MLGLGLGINKKAKGFGVPFSDEALHYSSRVDDTTRPDRTGIFDRTSVMSRMAVGDSSTYIRFVDFLSTALTYYDIVLGTEVVTATDGSGDFVLPTNGIAYIDISGNRWIFEEITDPTDNSQTTFYDTSGTYEAQAFVTHAGWVANSVHGVANSDEHGVTVAQALGKNLANVDSTVEATGLPASAWRNPITLLSADTITNGVAITVTPGTNYTISGTLTVGTDLQVLSADAAIVKGLGDTFNSLTYDVVYLRVKTDISGDFKLDNFMVELGSAPTTYEAWEGYYKDETHLIPYTDGQPLHALDNGDGTFSRQFCKAWLDTGAQAPLDSAGRIKHQVTRTDVAGTPDASGDYILLAQDYPLVQSADLTDTLVDDHTLDEPTNAVVDVATLNYQIGNQIFSKVDSGDLTKFLVYDRVMTNEEIARILLFLGTGEFAIDSDGDYAIDSNGDMAVAPKSEYYL